MEDQEYLRLADACLAKVSAWLEDFDSDELDFSVGDGLVTLEFADGTRFIFNRQAAAKQLWLAAGARAWHYKWDATTQTWVDDKDGHELYAQLAKVVSEKLGRSVTL
ncbi:MAG: iron donor protein CyaY [Candidatus Binatia bacterium]